VTSAREKLKAVRGVETTKAVLWIVGTILLIVVCEFCAFSLFDAQRQLTDSFTRALIGLIAFVFFLAPLPILVWLDNRHGREQGATR
jgi:hypothetical protein